MLLSFISIIGLLGTLLLFASSKKEDHNQERNIPLLDAGVALVEQDIAAYQPGRVAFEGTHWAAYTYDTGVIACGSFVKVTGRKGIALIVEPLPTPPAIAL